MLRAHPTKNLTIGIGGRAWYLQGMVDATYDQATIGDPTDSDNTTPPNYDTAAGLLEAALHRHGKSLQPPPLWSSRRDDLRLLTAPLALTGVSG